MACLAAIITTLSCSAGPNGRGLFCFERRRWRCSKQASASARRRQKTPGGDYSVPVSSIISFWWAASRKIGPRHDRRYDPAILIFQPLKAKKIAAAFDGGRISSDRGVMLLSITSIIMGGPTGKLARVSTYPTATGDRFLDRNRVTMGAALSQESSARPILMSRNNLTQGLGLGKCDANSQFVSNGCQ